jgi:hypothetical protein
LRWATAFIHATIDIGCSNRLHDISRTSIVSGDLKNVCLAFRIFQLSIIVLELLLLPVHIDCHLFRYSNTSRDLGHISIVSSDLENVRLALGIFLLSLAVPHLSLLPVDGVHI